MIAGGPPAGARVPAWPSREPFDTPCAQARRVLRYGKADQLKMMLANVKAKYPGFDATQYQANLGLAKRSTSGTRNEFQIS